MPFLTSAILKAIPVCALDSEVAITTVLASNDDARRKHCSMCQASPLTPVPGVGGDSHSPKL